MVSLRYLAGFRFSRVLGVQVAKGKGRSEECPDTLPSVRTYLAGDRCAVLAVDCEELSRFLETRPVSTEWRAEITAEGFLAMTVRKARAEDSRVRRPPSQCLTASRLKPNVSENRD